VAIFGITYPPIVRALVAAHKRGVDVRVISDRERLNDPKQRAAVETLSLAGIPIKVNRHENLMHLKQVVMDDEINTSGSMNQTGSGNRYNDERLDVFIDPVTSAKARDKFLSMWKDTERYQDLK
jgi:phosphatidylserine/phosphatidylglycerophosphate/cardiolipin synthase-like enzyme